jgi:hypothetical protein
VEERRWALLWETGRSFSHYWAEPSQTEPSCTVLACLSIHVLHIHRQRGSASLAWMIFRWDSATCKLKENYESTETKDKWFYNLNVFIGQIFVQAWVPLATMNTCQWWSGLNWENAPLFN